MDAYVLVLNAGSSSLKFSMFQRPEGGAWLVGARGQIEGIGTSPTFLVKGANGQKLVDEKLDSSVRDGRAAIDILGNWLRSKYQGGRIVGIGHRVVHGGSRFSGPTVVTPKFLSGLFRPMRN